MKKIIFSIVFLTLGWATSKAQTFNLGVKAGVNLAKLNADFASEENRLGYQIGAWARIGGASFYVQPEAYIGSKGNKFISIQQDNGNEVSAEGKVKFTTLDIPVLLGTKFGAKNLNFRLMAGPVISFVLDENSSFSSAYQQATDFSNYKNQALGLQAGAGVDVGSISVDLRYEAGLSNISKSEKYTQKPNLFQLSLGFKIF
ncbi:Outer membrane protein beta-barrel domain-containing protein [Pedobacter suwonensis]|uniref:Outer membrane protein beta-barrel domain-containing protein n=1 Tax=Pedobacter suwonensis TaxID=332999 RepID=A0A1I0TCY8_9SPHI|nr:porin family protein [Pedobacter suwonensis]SFA49577.1 Outer membrane protein beta-barrel domain-containing protein [Pedobacter suwonensis]